jgi:hypothetical protein
VTYFYRTRGLEDRLNGRIVRLKYLQPDNHPNLEGPLPEPKEDAKEPSEATS